jgi:hypothetical protein
MGHAMMSFLLQLFSTLCVLAWVVLGLSTHAQFIHFTYGFIGVPPSMTALPFGLVYFASGLLLALSVFIQAGLRTQRFLLQVKRDELKKEKAEVTALAGSDKIKALELKIQTLERALQKALSE